MSNEATAATPQSRKLEPADTHVTPGLAGRVRQIAGRLSFGLSVALIYAFLYLPAIVIALYSFDSSDVMSWPPDGFTLHWYEVAFRNEALMEGLKNSVIVGSISVAIAVVLGVPAGIGLSRFDFRGKTTFERILILPFLLPGVIGGIALLTVFLDLGFQLSLTSVIAGHATMLVPVVVIQVMVALSRWDRSLEAAAMDLGANEWKTFRHVLWPNLRGAVLGAALLGFAISLDEAARTFFLAGTSNTLPLVVFSTIHRTITPEINAVGTLILGVSLLALLMWAWLSGSDLLGRSSRARLN